MENDKEICDKEITSLFDNARDKLRNVETHARIQKKQIVIDLAKDLDGKIPTDTISAEIVTQLHDQVSERFIHECLDEKYKQKSRVDNARKQKKEPKEPQVISKLAALPPLNQEVEEDDKKVIMLDTDGGITIQEDENDEPPTTTCSSIMDKTFTTESYQQPSQEQEIKKDIDSQEKECISSKDLSFENGQLKKVIEKSNQLIQSENMVSSTTLIKNNRDIIDNILSCEFFMLFKKIREYMTPQHSRIGDAGKIWFNVKIDRETGNVISSNFGRIDKQQDGSLL